VVPRLAARAHVRARGPAVARAAVAPAAGEGGHHVCEARRAARRAASARRPARRRARREGTLRAGGIRGARAPPRRVAVLESDELRETRVPLLLLLLRALADQVHRLGCERTEPGGVAEAAGRRAPREMRARDVAPRLRDPTHLAGIPRASRRGFAHRRGVQRERVDRLLLGQRAPRHTAADRLVEALRVARRGSEQDVQLLVHLAAALKRQERGEAPEAHGRAGRQRVRPGAR